ncbi:GUN4 domain-containing protein [Floridanema aerugineum]|uniref:GUN4 domain-containing protein n=1 Tax=Floridaenema aerugineum BLCC-F46 TaxID=3153654 RepID=A0ABV4XCL4_9CYAN
MVGFSVQKEIYKSVGKDYQRLGDRVGWRVNRIWRVNTSLFEPLVGENYILTDNGPEAVDLTTGDRWRVAQKVWIPWWEMTFSLDAPPGHLPAAFWSWWVRLAGKKSTMYPRYRDWIGTLLERVDACGL